MEKDNFVQFELDIHGYDVGIVQARLTGNGDVLTAITILDTDDNEVRLVLSENEKDTLVEALRAL